MTRESAECGYPPQRVLPSPDLWPLISRLHIDEMAIVFHTDLYGQTTVISAGPGPGGAAAMLRGIIGIVGVA